METSLWQTYRDQGLVVLGVSDESIPTIEQFVNDQGLTFPVLRDNRGSVYNQYSISGGLSPYPRDYIIDRDGVVRYTNTEYDVRTMELIIEGLLEYHQTGIEEETIYIPSEYRLEQNYPNPFNPTTDIRCQIADSRFPIHTTLTVYNILGQEIRILVDEIMQPGTYTITWDGKDHKDNQVASGFYFYRLSAGDFADTRRMVLLR